MPGHAKLSNARRKIGAPLKAAIRLAGLFAGRRDGNIAILFGFMLAVLMFFTGGAVDYTRYNAVRADVVESMDAAGLAMAQIDAMNGPEIRNLSEAAREAYLKEQGIKFFYENFKHAAWVTDLDVDFDVTEATIVPKANGKVRTIFLRLGEKLYDGTSGPDSKLAYLKLGAETEITRSVMGNTEVALVLDITGSMSGQRIEDLKDAAKELIDILVRDDQTEYYTKVGLAPYSVAVNVGAHATTLRGSITPGRPITGATWRNGPARNISGATRANPVRVTTSTNHGYANGDVVYIAGVGGMTQINNRVFTVSNVSSNAFDLQGVNGTSFSNFSSGGTVSRCERANCELNVVSNAHGFNTGDIVHITGVGGMTQINNRTFQVTRIDANNFLLSNIVAGGFSNYTSGGSAACTNEGCEHLTFATAHGSKNITGATRASPVVISSSSHGFQNGDLVYITGVNGMTQLNNKLFTVANRTNHTYALANIDGSNFGTYSSGGSAQHRMTYRISTCVTERLGPQAYTDAPGATANLGRMYEDTRNYNPCNLPVITPLSRDKEGLKTAIENMGVQGSTSGHIGAAWGWYLISPNFATIFGADSVPAAYDDEEVSKSVILMTDGEFNSTFCQGVVSNDSLSGSGANQYRHSCDAPNGLSRDQALSLCNGMKSQGVNVYTVGFMISGSADTVALMNNCATSTAHAYITDDGEALKRAFATIARDIAQLHISR